MRGFGWDGLVTFGIFIIGKEESGNECSFDVPRREDNVKELTIDRIGEDRQEEKSGEEAL